MYSLVCVFNYDTSSKYFFHLNFIMHLYNFFFLPLNITNKKSSHSLCDAINLYYSENFALKPEISSAKRGQTLKLPKVERGDPLKILRDTDTDI